MRILFFSHIVVFLICGALLAGSSSQGQREIKKKEQELSRLREEIRAYEKRIKKSAQKEKLTLEDLDNLEQQISLIRKLIRSIHSEIEDLSKDIETSRVSIVELEQQLNLRKDHYASTVRSVYKRGRSYDIELLLSSKSINQAYIRMEYMKRFSQQRREEMMRIVEKKDDLQTQYVRLEEHLECQQQLLAENTQEAETLKKKADKRQKTLNALRKDKKLYHKEIARRSDAAKKVEDLIVELIERERIRKEKLAKEARERAARERAAREREKLGAKIEQPPEIETAETKTASMFELKKGKLRWPVSSGAIASQFGRQVNPRLKTVTQNTGIEISTPIGSKVYAVASAEVAVISFIPGYGNVVILNHGDGFCTVYAHLSDISVNESETVREGDVIAKSGDSISGSLLHFEIWKEREKQNPELWLARH